MDKKILIVRPDALGDVILMIPMLNTIKLNYPDSKIYTLQQKYTHSLLSNHDAVYKVLDDPIRIGKIKSLKDFFSFVKYIRSFDFDIVIFPYLELPYVLLAVLAGIKCRIGDGNKLGLRIFLTHSVKLNFRNMFLHEVEQNINLLRPLNIKKLFHYEFVFK